MCSLFSLLRSQFVFKFGSTFDGSLFVVLIEPEHEPRSENREV